MLGVEAGGVQGLGTAADREGCRYDLLLCIFVLLSYFSPALFMTGP